MVFFDEAVGGGMVLLAFVALGCGRGFHPWRESGGLTLYPLGVSVSGK